MENGMTMAWTKVMALGLLLWPLGCVVHVDDDPDGFGGSGGDDGYSGSGGDYGYSGSGGDGGNAGNGGDAGDGGELLAPTCEPEDGDSMDACVQCFKRNCCVEWVGCADETCTREWTDVAECVESNEPADADLLGMCISESSAAADDFVQANTQALLDCATTLNEDASDTLCSSECFGTDIFFD
jgi:hypothetical protein